MHSHIYIHYIFLLDKLGDIHLNTLNLFRQITYIEIMRNAMKNKLSLAKYYYT
jgi:hypothetical protein